MGWPPARRGEPTPRREAANSALDYQSFI